MDLIRQPFLPQDWNPRSLSTFSTFGGGQGSPPLLGLNGHTNGGLHIGSTGGGVGGVSVLVPPSKANGAVTVNGSAPPELLASPDVIAHCHKPAHPLGPEIVSHVPKPIGMPVAPPSIEGVVRPRHTHSKSLVGDELQPLPAPRHAHSRSLVDTMDLIPPKSPDGVGDARWRALVLAVFFFFVSSLFFSILVVKHVGLRDVSHYITFPY